MEEEKNNDGNAEKDGEIDSRLKDIPEEILKLYHNTFSSVDEDKSGFVSKKELVKCFEILEMEVTPNQVDFLVIFFCLFLC